MSKNIRDIIKELLNDNEEIYSIVGKVKEVDRAKRVCRVEPINGDAELFDVRLQSKVSSDIGLVLFPALESDVTVTFLSKDLTFVSQTTEIKDIKLDIGDFSLFIDAENFEKSVKNIVINTTDTKINADNYKLTGENAKFEISTLFEVFSAADLSLKAVNMLLEAAAIKIKGVTTIQGATTIQGTTNISGAVVMAAAVTMGGGENGGIPTASGLKTELDRVIAEVNKIRAALVGWTPISNDGGAALKARVGGLTSLNNVQTNNISNPNATH